MAKIDINKLYKLAKNNRENLGFKTELNVSDEKMTLKVKMTDEVVALIDKVVIKSIERRADVFLDGGVCKKRYLVATTFLPQEELSRPSYEIFFTEDIVETGQTSFRIPSTTAGAKLVEDMREALKRFVKYIVSSNGLNKSVKIVLED